MYIALIQYFSCGFLYTFCKKRKQGCKFFVRARGNGVWCDFDFDVNSPLPSIYGTKACLKFGTKGYLKMQ